MREIAKKDRQRQDDCGTKEEEEKEPRDQRKKGKDEVRGIEIVTGKSSFTDSTRGGGGGGGAGESFKRLQ